MASPSVRTKICLLGSGSTWVTTSYGGSQLLPLEDGRSRCVERAPGYARLAARVWKASSEETARRDAFERRNERQRVATSHFPNRRRCSLRPSATCRARTFVPFRSETSQPTDRQWTGLPASAISARGCHQLPECESIHSTSTSFLAVIAFRLLRHSTRPSPQAGAARARSEHRARG